MMTVLAWVVLLVTLPLVTAFCAGMLCGDYVRAWARVALKPPKRPRDQEC